MICLIIFCLNGIRHGRNATYEPGLICTSVTLFALVLHLNSTALSQSEPSNVFHVQCGSCFCGMQIGHEIVSNAHVRQLTMSL